MEFSEVLRTRRSVRNFRPDAVSDEVLERVVDLARFAPSAQNIQPWRVVAVRDETKRKEIAHLCFEQDFVGQAPVTLVVCAERYVDNYSWIRDNMRFIDTAIFMDHLTLAARAEGLGTCWVGAIDADRHLRLKRLLNVPESRDVVIVSPLGYPERDDAFRPTERRKAVKDILAYEQF